MDYEDLAKMDPATEQNINDDGQKDDMHKSMTYNAKAAVGNDTTNSDGPEHTKGEELRKSSGNISEPDAQSDPNLEEQGTERATPPGMPIDDNERIASPHPNFDTERHELVNEANEFI